MHKSEGKHYKTTLNSLQKKENARFSLNSLSKLYDNSIVDGRTIGSVQQEFHCSCCARNETLAGECKELIKASKYYCYWIIIKKKNEIYGPLSLEEYKELKDKLKISKNLVLIKE